MKLERALHLVYIRVRMLNQTLSTTTAKQDICFPCDVTVNDVELNEILTVECNAGHSFICDHATSA